MDFCKVTNFKQFQEFFQSYNGDNCLDALETHFKHFKREKCDLSYFKTDAPFPNDYWLSMV
jgi:hypothetical protein